MMGNLDWFPTSRRQIVSRVTLDTGGGGGGMVGAGGLGGLFGWFWRCGLVRKPWCCELDSVVLVRLSGGFWMECVVGLVEGGWIVSFLLGLVLGRDRRCGLCGVVVVAISRMVFDTSLGYCWVMLEE